MDECEWNRSTYNIQILLSNRHDKWLSLLNIQLQFIDEISFPSRHLFFVDILSILEEVTNSFYHFVCFTGVVVHNKGDRRRERETFFLLYR